MTGRFLVHAALLAAAVFSGLAVAVDDGEAAPLSPDYLSLAEGAVPVAVLADDSLKVGIDQALQLIDGNVQRAVITPKPGSDATTITFVYRLPAATTFSSFAVPNVLETPSPSQTFFRQIDIAGSSDGEDGSFTTLASATLATHATTGMTTELAVADPSPVTWVRVTLSGGIDVQSEKTFFEFSEVVGRGSQAPVPLLETFSGKWKDRGIRLELYQDGPSVHGCYDGTGDLSGTVSGNILRATGKHRTSGVGSVFLLTVNSDGNVVGVSSTNKAPFRLYTATSAPQSQTECGVPSPTVGCGSVLHGINFDYDSATIRADSAPLLDQLYRGLMDAPEDRITIVGHTSSEGSDAYNLALSRQRAEAVVAALVDRGIAAQRLAASGQGESQPIADNSSEAGRSLNRRVEVSCL